MSRRSSSGSRRGKLALGLALVCGLVAFAGAAVLALALVQTLVPQLPAGKEEVATRAWVFGGVLALVVGAVTAAAGWQRGGSVAGRVGEIASAVARIGRGSGEVRVRVAGDDEVTALGRAVQHLAHDVGVMVDEMQQKGGRSGALDQQVRALRDLTLDDPLDQADGYEVDGSLAAGSKGGLDYFGAIAHDGRSTLYAISAEGISPISVVALRMARDEIVRALKAGANARKALSHTNRVLHRTMPRGVCAKATLVELGADESKLYQAGYRAKLWICTAGEVLELEAEGLALGLDEGPVFEKGLRPETVAMQPGVRLVVTNEAGSRSQALLDLIRAHSPKNTAAFLNLVLGGVEADADDDGLADDVLLLTAKRF